MADDERPTEARRSELADETESHQRNPRQAEVTEAIEQLTAETGHRPEGAYRDPENLARTLAGLDDTPRG
jgi:hypothetical protein